MQKNMLIAVGGGSVSAAASMAFFSGTPGALLFVCMTTLPLFLVALSMGPTAGMVACVAGLFVAFLVGDILNAGSYGLLHAFPAWLVFRHVLRQSENSTGDRIWAPVGHILGLLTLVGASLILVAGLFVADINGGIQGTIRVHLNQVFSVMSLNLGKGDLENLTDMLVAMLPGAMGASWVLITVLNVSLAQSVLVKSAKNIRPSPSFTSLTLPQWVAVPMLVAGVVSVLTSGDVRYMAQNMTIILAFPYFFLGLAVTHWAVDHVKNFRTPLFIGLYLILLFSGWAVMLVMALGMLEQWAGIRHRFSRNERISSSDLDIDT